ncbi:MAG: mucoidy inhibitor MuiA family protein [Proteobacteria bacterium]|nr:mucoidy inhibitor MuiA family protein [Pseudomonadota bacterium]
MRIRWVWSAALAMLLFAAPAPAAQKKPAIVSPTDIEAVTVYPRRALVTRTGQARLAAGEQAIEVRGLPYGLLDRSVTVSARMSGGLTILGVEVKRYYSGAKRPPAEEALRAKIDALKQRRQGLYDQRRVIDGLLSFLKSMGRVTADRLNKRLLFKVPDGKNLDSLMTFVETKSLALLKNRRETLVGLQKVNRRFRELYQQLRLISRGRTTRSKVVLIRVRAKRGGQAKFAVKYLVHGATWRPLYTVRRQVGSGRLTLTMSGEIRQRTGEDWSGVRLTLSTARPSLGARAPKLYPRYLSFYQPRPKLATKAAQRYQARTKRGIVAQRQLAAGGVTRDASPRLRRADERRADRITAAISSGLGSHQFAIKFKVDVPADGHFHKTTILVRELKSELVYVAVPSRSSSVFLRAKVVNDTGATLLPGRVDVFLGPDYVGRSSLGLLAEGQSFNLDLGVDPQIRLKWQRLDLKRGRSGLFGGSRKVSFLWRAEIVSYKKKAVTLHLLAQTPVSTEQKIEISVEPKPEPKRWDKKRGMIWWVLKLEPKKKVVVDLGYTVRYPKDKHVRGI